MGTDTALNSGDCNPPLRFIAQSTKNFQGLVSALWAIQALNVSCTPSSFPPGDVLAAHQRPHQEVAGRMRGDDRQLVNPTKRSFKEETLESDLESKDLG